MKMIINNRSDSKVSRLFQSMVLLGSLSILPLGMVSAHDLEAFEKRLEKAVDKGEISDLDAELILEVLEKREEDMERASRHALEQHREHAELREHEERLHREQAELRRRTDREHAERDRPSSEHVERAKIEAIVQEIKEAEAAGKITPKQAEGTMRGLREMNRHGKDSDKGDHGKKDSDRKGHAGKTTDMDWDGIKRRIEHAVREGDMTREEANAKYRELKGKEGRREDVGRKGGDRKPDGDRRAKMQSIRREIEQAVKEGKMTREEAGRKMRGLHERMAAGERGKPRDKERGDQMPERLKAMGMRLREAVKNGDMTEEEARKKWAEIEKHMESHKDGDER